MGTIREHSLEVIIPIAVLTGVASTFAGAAYIIGDAITQPEQNGYSCNYDETSSRFTIRNTDGEIVHESSPLQQAFMREAQHSGYQQSWIFPTDDQPYELHQSTGCKVDYGWREIEALSTPTYRADLG